MAFAHSSPVYDGVLGGVGGRLRQTSAGKTHKRPLLREVQGQLQENLNARVREEPDAVFCAQRQSNGRQRTCRNCFTPEWPGKREKKAGHPGGFNTSVNVGSGARYVLVTSKEKLIKGKGGG